MPLVNCEIILDLTWYANCVTSSNVVNLATIFAITHTTDNSSDSNFINFR